MIILMSRYRDDCGMPELGTNPQVKRYSRKYKSFSTFRRYNTRGLLPGKYFVEIWYDENKFYSDPARTFDYTIPTPEA